MKVEKRALGRGLDALIPKKEQQPVPVASQEQSPQQPQQETQPKEYTYVDVSLLKPSFYQSRIDIPEAELKELAESIKANGLIQPLVVRKGQGHYEVLAGSRRLSASKLLGLKELPVIVKEVDDEQALVLSILENLQRQDLNPIEEAESFKRLMEEFGHSQDEIADLVSKDRTTVANHLRLLGLPQEIKDALRDRVITMSAARTILGVTDEKEQIALFRRLQQGEKLTIRELEQAVRQSKALKPKATEKKPVNLYVKAVQDELQKTLGRKVVIQSNGKKGKLILEFYSPDDLDRLIKEIARTSRAES